MNFTSKLKDSAKYCGRIAPTPSGFLHIGHAQTFMIAAKRAEVFQGDLILRIEDLDVQRCKPGFLEVRIRLCSIWMRCRL